MWILIIKDSESSEATFWGTSGQSLKTRARKIYHEWGCNLNFTILNPQKEIWSRCTQKDSAERLIWVSS